MAKRKKKPKFTPTPEQEAALQDYIEWAGAGWESQLQTDFMRAGSRWSGEWAHLQQVRNAPGGMEWAFSHGQRGTNPIDYEDQEAVEAAVEKVKDKYEPKIRRMLEEICALATEEGYECNGPSDWSDETYKWAVMITPKGGEVEDSVDVSVEIAESGPYGGDPGGLNFSLDVVGYEGEIIGGFAPYNFTSDVWVPVDATEAIENRWQIFDNGVEPYGVGQSIDDFVARKAERGNNPSTRKMKNKLLR